jgi:hypothetical protein
MKLPSYVDRVEDDADSVLSEVSLSLHEREL